jgi:SNF2 family DNA or RNA helicase
VRFLLENSVGGLLLDPGLRKTSITLAALKVLREEGIVRKTLVIAPLRVVYEVWPEEIDKWSDFRDTRYAILHGAKKEAALNSAADLYLINPEGLQWLFVMLQGKPFPFDVLVIDESTKFKHTNTARFKLLRPYLPKFGRRYILTGSPAPNGLMDLFGQIYVIDLGRSLGAYISHYRNRFFNKTGYGGYTYVLQDDAEQEIYAAIAPYVLRMSQEEYLKLPPLVDVTRTVELPPLARKQYEQMEATFMLLLEKGKVNAANAAVVGGKLRQIANGGVYLDPKGSGPGEKRGAAVMHEAKAEMLVELLEELSGQPTLVAYEFHHDLDRLLPYLKKAGFGDVPHIAGGVTTARFKQIKDDWNAGRIPVLLAQPQSVQHGLNLQKTGRAIIWFSIPWDLEVYFQFIRRIWRSGVTERVMNYRIVAKKTTDEAILAALSRKHNTERALLDAIREYHRAKKTP